MILLLLLLLLFSLNDFEKRRNGVSSKMADGSWTRSSEEIVCLAFVYIVNHSRESNLWKEAQQ